MHKNTRKVLVARSELQTDRHLERRVEGSQNKQLLYFVNNAENTDQKVGKRRHWAELSCRSVEKFFRHIQNFSQTCLSRSYRLQSFGFQLIPNARLTYLSFRLIYNIPLLERNNFGRKYSFIHENCTP